MHSANPRNCSVRFLAKILLVMNGLRASAISKEQKIIIKKLKRRHEQANMQ